MWSLCRTHVQAISRRVFGADDFAEATGPTHTPPLSLDPDKPTRILATYRRPRPQDGWAAAGGLLDKVVVVVSVLMPLIQALYNFVDVVLDVVVARQLAVGGDHLLAVASATITFITLAVSVYMLAAERQYVLFGEQSAPACLTLPMIPPLCCRQICGCDMPSLVTGRLVQRGGCSDVRIT